MMATRRLAIAAVATLVALACAALRLSTRYRPEPVRATNAEGDAACLSCHRERAIFEASAHHLTSRRPTGASIAGSFHTGENVLPTRNRLLHFRMDSTGAGFFETAVMGRAPDTTTESERFAFVIGSGRKGQSYLWRADDRLYELPVSYWKGLG